MQPSKLVLLATPTKPPMYAAACNTPLPSNTKVNFDKLTLLSVELFASIAINDDFNTFVCFCANVFTNFVGLLSVSAILIFLIVALLIFLNNAKPSYFVTSAFEMFTLPKPNNERLFPSNTPENVFAMIAPYVFNLLAKSTPDISIELTNSNCLSAFNAMFKSCSTVAMP